MYRASGSRWVRKPLAPAPTGLLHVISCPAVTLTCLSIRLALATTMVAMASADNPAGVPNPGGPSLRELAARRGIEIGANFPGLVYGKAPNNWETSRTIAIEKAIAAEQFTMMTAGWEMYPGKSWTGPGQYDFAGADAVVAWCQEHGLRVHGHGLGYACRVDWLLKLPAATEADRAHVRAVYEQYVRDTVSHFAGHVQMWDVCNEQLLPAYVFSGYQTRQPYWRAYQTDPAYPVSGVEWYRRTFRLAHETDPQARLVLLEFNNEVLCPKSDRLYALVRQLLAEGVPVHGVGFQMHLATDLNRSKGHGLATDEDYFASMSRNLARFAELGVELWVTELDVRVDPTKALAEELSRQAMIYARVTEVALATPGFRGLKLWGITDRSIWGGPVEGRPHLFDETGAPKPAFFAVQRALQAEQEPGNTEPAIAGRSQR